MNILCGNSNNSIGENIQWLAISHLSSAIQLPTLCAHAICCAINYSPVGITRRDLHMNTDVLSVVRWLADYHFPHIRVIFQNRIRKYACYDKLQQSLSGVLIKMYIRCTPHKGIFLASPELDSFINYSPLLLVSTYY